MRRSPGTPDPYNRERTVLPWLQPLVISLLLLPIAVISGCATSLSERGSQVKVLGSLPAGQEGRYEQLGVVTCQHEQNLASLDFNKEICERKLRNTAGEKGADVVVIETVETFPGTATVGAFMIGITYKKR